MRAPAGISTFDRDKNFSKAAAEVFDILIIGGGIMGAGIALDAASRNFKVLLVEKQDFAAGTSSRSTKLIHGGLRYLKNFEFGLVRTVARERKILQHLAPHLVTPEPMLLPVLESTSYGYWSTAAGLTLYEFLGQVNKPECHQMLRRKQTLKQEPLLNPEGLKGSGLFTEYRTDDARLTLEVLKTAASFGAICLNYTSLQEFTYSPENKLTGGIIRNEENSNNFQVKARCVINATGPWSVELIQKDQPIAKPLLFHTKGVHLVVPFNKLPLKQSVYFDIPGGRMLFAIPRQQITYLGTTDTPFKGDLANPQVEPEDAIYLIEQINRMFPQAKLTLEDIVSSWAGVRPLINEPGKNPTNISRKDEILISDSGLVTVAGGKLTGYRHLAEEVVNKAIATHFPGNKQLSQTKKIKLSAGDFAGSKAVKTFQQKLEIEFETLGISAEKFGWLVRNYGIFADQILQKTTEFQQVKLPPEIALLKAEVWFCIHSEAATNLSDFLIRRTGKLYFEREKIVEILPFISKTFQEYLGWSEEKLTQHLSEFNQKYEAAVAFKNGA